MIRLAANHLGTKAKVCLSVDPKIDSIYRPQKYSLFCHYCMAYSLTGNSGPHRVVDKLFSNTRYFVIKSNNYENVQIAKDRVSYGWCALFGCNLTLSLIFCCYRVFGQLHHTMKRNLIKHTR